MFRCVLFDLDDTLFDHSGAADDGFVAWALDLGIDGPTNLPRWRSLEAQFFAEYGQGRMGFLDQRRARVRELLGVDLDDAEADATFAGYLAHYESSWRGFDDVRAALRWCEVRDVVVGLVTNGEAVMQRAKASRIGLPDDLLIVTPDDAGAPKPDPAMFLLACERLGVAPGEALVVGDNLVHDIEAARATGLQAALVRRRDTVEGSAPSLLHVLRPELSLRPWHEDDARALLAAVAGAPDLERQMPALPDVATAKAWIASVAGEWILALCADDHPVGQVALTHRDPRHQTAWVSYWAAMEARGMGWLSRATATVCDWALRVGGVRRLELGHRVNNPASGRVAAKAGFIAEGIERDKLLYDGIGYDIRTMSRLATDPWPGLEPIPMETPGRD